MRGRRLLPALLTLGALAAPLGAQPLSLGPEIRIFSHPTSITSSPSLAAGADGGFLAAWYFGGYFGGLPAALAIGPDDAPRQLSPARLSAGGEGRRSSPRTAPLAGGGAVVIWDILQEVNPFRTDRRLIGAILDATGHPVVSGVLAQDVVWAAVTGDPSGGFIVVWKDGTARIAAQRFDALGAPRTGPLAVTPDGDQPRIASLPDGGFAVAWLRGATYNVPLDTLPYYREGSVLLRIFRPDGTPAGPEIEIDQGEGRSRRDVRVDADAAGRLVVAWVEGETDLVSLSGFGVWQIRAQRFTATGEPLGDRLTVHEIAAANRGLFLGDVAVRPDGSFLVLWGERDRVVFVGGGTFAEFESDTYFRAYSASSAPLAPPALVHDVAAGDQDQGEAEATPGGWVVSWRRQSETVTENLVRRISAPADPCGPGTPLCLDGSRFRAEVTWRVPATGAEGTGTPIPLTDDTGAFWFFSPANYELVVKVLDGTAINGRFWVFYGSLTDVEFDLTVTDTVTGQQRTYHNPAGTMASQADTQAF